MHQSILHYMIATLLLHMYYCKEKNSSSLTAALMFFFVLHTAREGDRTTTKEGLVFTGHWLFSDQPSSSNSVICNQMSGEVEAKVNLMATKFAQR